MASHQGKAVAPRSCSPVAPRSGSKAFFVFVLFFSPGGKQKLSPYSLLLLPFALACCSSGNSQRQKPEAKARGREAKEK